MGWFYQDRCDICGRFVSLGASGVSWSRSWGYDWEGCPELHDAVWRCAKCTTEHGAKETNCNESESKYHGTNP